MMTSETDHRPIPDPPPTATASPRGHAAARPRNKALMAVAAIGALIVTGVVVSAVGSHHGSPASVGVGQRGPVSGTPRLNGTFTLWGSSSRGGPSAAGASPTSDPCAPNPKFADVAVGTVVTITDPSGRALAHAALAKPGPDPYRLGCRYHFTVDHLAPAPSYRVVVGNRDGLTYSRDDLVQSGWVVALNLGGGA